MQGYQHIGIKLIISEEEKQTKIYGKKITWFIVNSANYANKSLQLKNASTHITNQSLSNFHYQQHFIFRMESFTFGTSVATRALSSIRNRGHPFSLWPSILKVIQDFIVFDVVVVVAVEKATILSNLRFCFCWGDKTGVEDPPRKIFKNLLTKMK